jgi:hypothetical protein
VIEVEAVKAALRVTAILDWYGVRYHEAPTIRLKVCPRCGATSRRDAIAIDRAIGRWVHHSGPSAADSPCRGDALELVAAFEGLDRDRDFGRLLQRAAMIAGITEGMSSAELDEIRQCRARQQATFERERAARRVAATAAVPGRWAQLRRRSAPGEAYLAGRGLDPAELTRTDSVRFDRSGNPAVRLHAYDGAIANIARRMRDPSVPCKTPVLPDCTTDGTLVGKVGDIDTTGGGPDVAILTEGIADTLAGVLAFPGCVIVGASGADRLKHIAAAIAPRLVEARGWLLVVPHVDGGKGEECAADAVIAAERVGLKLDESIHLVDVRPHKDLADAWRDGWRWRWL